MINKKTFKKTFDNEATQSLNKEVCKCIDKTSKDRTLDIVIGILKKKKNTYSEYVLHKTDLEELINALATYKLLGAQIKCDIDGDIVRLWKNTSSLFCDNLYYICNSLAFISNTDVQEKHEMLYVYKVVYNFNHCLRKK